MVIVVWLVAIIGMSFMLLIFAAALMQPSEPESPSVQRPARLDQAPVVPLREEDQGAQAARDYEQLTEKYHQLIDELYDFGDGVAAKCEEATAEVGRHSWGTDEL